MDILVCMCFRTNRRKTKYIGAICGMGWDRMTNGPCLPDHDIEIHFDSEFTIDDIAQVCV